MLKLSTTGGGLLFSTYLGGSGLDEGTGIAIDAARNVYVTGTTRSTDFPRASPFQAAIGGNTDAFVAKLNPAGSALLYSSFLGGSATDSALAIAADPAGNVDRRRHDELGGLSQSRSRRRAPSAASSTPSSRAFAPNGTLIFSTFWGGADIDSAQAVTLDS